MPSAAVKDNQLPAAGVFHTNPRIIVTTRHHGLTESRRDEAKRGRQAQAKFLALRPDHEWVLLADEEHVKRLFAHVSLSIGALIYVGLIAEHVSKLVRSHGK